MKAHFVSPPFDLPKISAGPGVFVGRSGAPLTSQTTFTLNSLTSQMTFTISAPGYRNVVWEVGGAPDLPTNTAGPGVFFGSSDAP